MSCPPLNQLLQYITYELTAAQAKKLLSHVRQCSHCLQSIQFINKLRDSIKSNPIAVDMAPSECLDTARLCAFAENRIAEAEKQKAIRHFLVCERCLDNILNLQNVLQTAPVEEIAIPDGMLRKVQAMQPDKDMLPIFNDLKEKHRHKRHYSSNRRVWFNKLSRALSFSNLPTWGKISLGFGVAFLLILLQFDPYPENNTNYQKGIRAVKIANRIMLVSPEVEIATIFPEFVWKDVESSKKYVINVWSDTMGKVIWCDTTYQNRISFPADGEIRLKPNHSYSWHVKAVFTNGTLITSETRNFKIVKKNLPSIFD